MPYSKQLERLVATDNRVGEYEYDPSNDMGQHWLHLAGDYRIDGNGESSIHESTVRDVLHELARVSRSPSPAG